MLQADRHAVRRAAPPLDTRPGRQGKTLPRGVYYSHNGKKFKVLSLVNGRLTYDGTFSTVEEASAVATAWRGSPACKVAA